MEYVNEVIYRRTNAIDETIEALTKIKTRLETSGITVKEAQQIIDDTIEASRNSVRAKLTDNGIGEADLKKSIEWVESVGTRLSEKQKSISKCIGDQLKNITKSNIDGFKTLDRLRRYITCNSSCNLLDAKQDLSLVLWIRHF